MTNIYLKTTMYMVALLLLSFPARAQQRLMEKLDRGLVALESEDGVFLSWRKLAADPAGLSFRVYRNDTLITTTALTGSTNYVDAAGSTDAYYHLEVVTDGTVTETSDAVVVWGGGYHTVPLQTPAGYQPNDASVADLDGDGQLEIIVKLEGLTKDNSQSGVTDPVYLHAYEMNGTLLWSIDLGINIRGGAHYTQFMVYDLDGDGLAEVVCKTAPGTRDGSGAFLSDGVAGADDDAADYRNENGYILEGPEYLTLFNGMTGEEVSTVTYEPVRGNVGDWGDTYGNRVDRFLAGVAYFDRLPSVVMARGYYTRSVLSAWDYVDGELVQRWIFDTDSGGTGKDGNAYSLYTGQGAHSLSVGDIDQDGKDEIMYGAMAVDDDGVGLYVTGNNHGDATHLGDFLPDRPGLEYFMPSESAFSTNRITGEPIPAIYLTDASDGTVLWQKEVTEKADIGRAMVADVSAATQGAEFWASSGFGVYDAEGNQIDRTSGRPSINFGSWWDGDLQRELLDGNTITKWTPDMQTALLAPAGVESNNGTKATPALSGDILGDWREEVIWRTADNQSLRIYSTTIPTDYSFYTLLQDPQYRLALTWQNVGYNQPPHPSFYLGGGMEEPPTPNIAAAVPEVSPSLQITNPVIGQTSSQGSTLYATVRSDGFDAPTTVYLSSDGNLLASDTTPPYAINLDTLSSGTYTLVAWAYAADSTVVRSAPVSYTVDLGAPDVRLTSPDAGTLFSIDDRITLTADATDPNGTIQQVDFYIGEQAVATVTTAPFSAEVDNPGYGVFDVWAVVTDNDGLKDTSSLRSISVGQGTIIQESEMAFCGFLNLGTIDSNNEGFTGDGFANTENQEGEGVSWAIVIPAAGAYQMQFRYASQGQRDAVVSIGDIITDEPVNFPPSESWTSWTTTATQVVNLPAGNHEVTLTATTGGGLGNIDYLQVLSFNETAAQGLDCAELSTSTKAVDAASDRLSVYPVPAFGTVTFKLHQPGAHITRLTLYGSTGQRVLSREYATEQVELNVTRITPGMYLAQLETSSGRKYTRRMVID